MQLTKRPRKIWFLTIALIGIGGSLFVPSCKKKEEGQQDLSPRDKILGTWRRNLRAYDRNGNHLIDSSEVNYSPSAKATDTIILTLVPDATFTRSQIFKGIPYSENGTWHLQQNDGEIVLQPTTSTSRVDTFRLDTISQAYFLQHRMDSTGLNYYESFVRPN